MSWHSSIGAAPVKESDRCGRDQCVDICFSAIISELVYLPAAETQNPSLNTPFWDEVNDSLFCRSSSQFGFTKSFSKLLKAPFNIARVGIKHNNQRGFRACRPSTVTLDLRCVMLAHPLFSAASTAWQIHVSNLGLIIESQQVPADKSLVALVFSKDNELGRFTHVPSRERRVLKEEGRCWDLREIPGHEQSRLLLG